ncbi:hypothetical protein F2Q69_00015367, partial [Brassica cretica]
MRSTGSSSTSVYCLSTVEDCVLRVEFVRLSADTSCFNFFHELTAIHEILSKMGYKDDEGIANQLSFQMWTNQMQESLNYKKKGYVAFRSKDYTTAFIDGGTMMSPTVHARRCLLYVMNENAQEALTDALQAQVVSPEWPTALYLKAALLVQARHGPMHRKLLNT